MAATTLPARQFCAVLCCAADCMLGWCVALTCAVMAMLWVMWALCLPRVMVMVMVVLNATIRNHIRCRECHFWPGSVLL